MSDTNFVRSSRYHVARTPDCSETYLRSNLEGVSRLTQSLFSNHNAYLWA